ncbi:MAG: hypothetical protein IJY36_06985 [Coprobacter sp.]|nr:hypothetical protein [Coprobacter sp.]
MEMFTLMELYQIFHSEKAHRRRMQKYDNCRVYRHIPKEVLMESLMGIEEKVRTRIAEIKRDALDF